LYFLYAWSTDSVFVHVDYCDGRNEYESGINCQNTCRNIKQIYVSNVLTSKHTIDIEDLIQKLRGITCIRMSHSVVGFMLYMHSCYGDNFPQFAGLWIALVIVLSLVICIAAFFFARRHTKTCRRHYIFNYAVLEFAHACRLA
jgi:hypothetical protein